MFYTSEVLLRCLISSKQFEDKNDHTRDERQEEQMSQDLDKRKG